MFLSGSVATSDGTSLPQNVIVERLCNTRVRQQVYANAHGDFTMELGTMTEAVLDATGESDPNSGMSKGAINLGVPRRDLANCELRASISGFRSNTVNLVELSPSGTSVNVGSIVVERMTKVKGMTLSAAPFKAPENARRAYRKGMEALRHEKLGEAQQQFEQAVKMYPKYVSAWFELGSVLRKEKQSEAAQAAFLQATSLDSKFLPPYVSLAAVAFEAQDWPQVLGLTQHILAHDSLNYAKVTGYVLDLDAVDYAEAYFYNSAANFNLNRLNEAEKSGLQAERLDVRPRFPQLHLLLAEIFMRKNENARAIDELQMFLVSVPQGHNADLARERLAKLEKRENDGRPLSETIKQN
jgi:tetratricopeptide (TPR) repeat protein